MSRPIGEMGGDNFHRQMRGIAFRAPEYQHLMFGKNLERIGIEKSDLWSADVQPALSFILRYHAFARAGGEQAGYGSIAHSALKSLSGDSISNPSGHSLWAVFKEKCDDRGIGVNESINKGVILGLSELATKEGNLFLWIEEMVDAKGRLEDVYRRLEDIRGIGRKIATFILRDVIWFLGLEESIRPQDLKFLQPIDRWVRRVAEQLFLDIEGLDRNEVATRLAKECRRCGISNAEFNQGAWYLSRIELGGEIGTLQTKIRSGLHSPTRV